MGSYFRHLRNFNEGKEYHEKALIITKKIFGEEHADVASTYNKLGNDYGYLGKYNEAKEYHEKAMIIKKIFCDEHAKQCSKGDDCRKNARNNLKVCNQRRKTDSTFLTSSKCLRLENC